MTLHKGRPIWSQQHTPFAAHRLADQEFRRSGHV